MSMNRRKFLAFGLGFGVRLRAEAEPVWQLKFIRTDDLLQVRRGGPTGDLLQIEGKGDATHTWKSADGAATVDVPEWIAKTLGDVKTFRLWAGISGESPLCEMEVINGGVVKAHWKFTQSMQAQFERSSA
jgi:hypothetical protein